MLEFTHLKKRGEPTMNNRRKVVRWCVIIIVWLFYAACTSKQPAEKAVSTSPSMKQGNTTQKNASKSQPGEPQKKEKTITYATNPERFVEEKLPPYKFNITNPKTAQEHFNVAVYEHTNKHLDRAIEEYKKALELKPDWAIAHFRLARAYQEKGNRDEAIAHWEKATLYDPRYYEAHFLLALAYKERGDAKKAIESYAKLLNYPPARMEAHYRLGLWYQDLGDGRKAREHLENYRQLALQSKSKEYESERFQRALKDLEKLSQKR